MEGIDDTRHYLPQSSSGGNPLFPAPFPPFHLQEDPLLTATEPLPSLLVLILDTHPQAWAAISDTLTLSAAVANILVFINAHLACNYFNRVAVLASHTHKAQWLYPSPSLPQQPQHHPRLDASGDTPMRDTSPGAQRNGNNPNSTKYRPFAVIETTLLTNLTALLSTPPAASAASTSTSLSGALTLALSYINKATLTSDSTTVPPPSSAPSASGLQPRILHISLSLPSSSTSTSLSAQYIPLMNTIFACQRLSIPIDVLAIPLSPTSTPAPFLQQASDATSGIYLSLTSPKGLLQYLMFAFLPDRLARSYLIPPTGTDVDFRAACFCHRRVVDIGFVCSICLSIFCEPPDGGDCLTCGTHLAMGDYGGRPVVIARRKKKRRRDGLGSGVDTPTPAAG